MTPEELFRKGGAERHENLKGVERFVRISRPVSTIPANLLSAHLGANFAYAAAMQTRLMILMVIGATACESRALTQRSDLASADLGPTQFPTGTYTNCAKGTFSTSGQELNVSGFDTGGALTVSHNGANIESTYVDENGVAQSVHFAPSTNTSASLVDPGQTIPGFGVQCVRGLGNVATKPASMVLRAGTLSYNAGAAFITLRGGVQSTASADADACGAGSNLDTTFWLLCEERHGDALPSVDEAAANASAPAVATQIPLGDFTCSSEVATHARINNKDWFISGGASGTLTLTADGLNITAHYSGDSGIAGSLRMLTTSATTAGTETVQTLAAPCGVSAETNAPSQTFAPFTVSVASLAWVDSALIISFAGDRTATDACPAAQLAGGVICSR